MGHQWQTDKFGFHVLGKMANNELSNTNGVKIHPFNGEVHITHWDQVSYPTYSKIFCNKE
jgi:hypothetical protein